LPVLASWAISRRLMVARDGKTIIDDANAFGQEWRVLDTEPSLFQPGCPSASPRCAPFLLPCRQASSAVASWKCPRSIKLAAEELASAGAGQGRCVRRRDDSDLEMAVVSATKKSRGLRVALQAFSCTLWLIRCDDCWWSPDIYYIDWFLYSRREPESRDYSSALTQIKKRKELEQSDFFLKSILHIVSRLD
jgi:hypothetical protein